jgi:mRNA-degrading endonuclease toxin of MazEF toxin-antitoxin module
MNRGDVILVRFPQPSGVRGKKRPAVIVQSDAYAGAISTLVVAEVTKNLTMAGDSECLFIYANTPDGKATGLVRDAVVSCLVLVTVYAHTVAQVLGTLSPTMNQSLNDCPNAALALPEGAEPGEKSSGELDK